MVGIVIVSHSAKLAAGVEELARQVTQTPVSIAIAAGIDDPENPFGTDALQIHTAIASVYSEAGVVVLMDLGSAVMNAEMALEFLTEEERGNIKLCEAPLVEGAIAAVVEASSNAPLERVVDSARNALIGKISQLVDVVKESSLVENLNNITDNKADSKQKIKLVVSHEHGLHLRPAAQLVITANRFPAVITLQNLTTKSQIVSAKSVNQVMLLGVRQGHEIEIAAEGEGANLALQALRELIENQLEEPSVSSPSPVSPTSSSSSLVGVPASPGIAIAPVILYQPSIPEVSTEKADNPQLEWQKLQQAIDKAIAELENRVHRESDTSASIFTAHLLYLQDTELINQTRSLIFEENFTAAAAWKKVIEDSIASYQALSDTYLQARAADVKDVGMQVLHLLMGVDTQPITLPQAGILVTIDLTVSQVAQINPEQVLGICTAEGTATSHSALIANQLGIPMVVGLGLDLLTLPDNTPLALDGKTGEIWIEPSAQTCEKLRSQQELSPKPKILANVQTLDGKTIPVLANIVSQTNAQTAIKFGADGVGLLRTEFLYLERTTPPSEAEQLETINAIAKTLGERPLTIRTLDIGGDKPLPYLDLPTEANPFLGLRGIRQSLAHPEMLKIQLRAILRASAKYKIKLMFPMISAIAEIIAAKQILAEVQAELTQEGINFDQSLLIGMMIEVPAAVMMSEQLAAEVDFFSIGTNDLSQYTMAAERTNPHVAALADALAPAVLRMIKDTVGAAHNVGITVSVCGQLASEPTAVPILLGLGVDELSANPPAIPTIKSTILGMKVSEAEKIAAAVLQLDSAVAVREYLSCLAMQK